MDCFQLHILGCGSALPTKHHLLSAQVLNMRGKLFLIDCGEGTQLQIRKVKLNFNNIKDVFISHLHGDHCFGLMGLISTMSLLGRNAPLRIHAHPDLEGILKPQLDYFCREMSYEVQFVPFNPKVSELIYEDRSLQIYSIPLIHRVTSTGFLFKERPRQRHILKEMIDFYQIPLREIPLIKDGADFTTADGEVIPNKYLTKDPAPAKSYAYCSDTAYSEKIIPIIKGVDVLYHEATFGEDQQAMADYTQHSTAKQAATIAQKADVGKLIIGHYSARYPDENVLLEQAKTIFQNTVLADEEAVFDI